MADPRKASITVSYNGTDITADISADLISFTYIDKASSESDELEIVMHDREGKWMGVFYPKMTSKGG